MKRPVEVGVLVPNGFMGKAPEPQEFAEFFRAVEELGFHSLWAMERVIHAQATVYHPFTTLAWAASMTSRVRLGTAVVLATLRHPLLLAKAAATLDYMSGGRFTFGISLGGRPEEYQTLGIPMRQRPRRLEETIALLRQLFSGKEVSFQGRHFPYEGPSVGPRPRTAGGIPIVLGGTVEPLLRRAGALADGWIAGATGTWTPEQFRERWQKVERYAREAGRDPSTLEAGMQLYFAVDDTAEKARQRLAPRVSGYYGPRFDAEKCVYGPPEVCAEKLRAFVDAGVRTLILSPVWPSVRELERIQRQVVPLLR